MPVDVDFSQNTLKLISRRYVCGHCGADVGSEKGWNGAGGGRQVFIYICPACGRPTYFDMMGEQIPGPLEGTTVERLPADVGKLYTEARRALSGAAPTASVLACRKILMHVAVEKGAPENGTFLSYVEFLSEKNFVPAGSKPWVDYIRKRSNKANHELDLMSAQDARALLEFTAMMLRVIYDFPGRIPATP